MGEKEIAPEIGLWRMALPKKRPKKKTTNKKKEDFYQRSSRPLRSFEVEPDMNLTTREMEVLELVALGYTNRKIGEMMYLAEETIKTHVKHILARMNAVNRAHMVHLAWENGLLSTISTEKLKSLSPPSRQTSEKAWNESPENRLKRAMRD